MSYFSRRLRLKEQGTESNGFWTQDLAANTEFRHSAFSRAVSAVRPFEVREGMEGEHTPETDLIRHHQDLEEGEISVFYNQDKKYPVFKRE